MGMGYLSEIGLPGIRVQAIPTLPASQTRDTITFAWRDGEDGYAGGLLRSFFGPSGT